MAHANARLTVHGRRLLVVRVRSWGWPVAHAAKAMGVSRQCAHRWLRRYDEEGPAGLVERSSVPLQQPDRTAPALEQSVIQVREATRWGPDRIAAVTRVPARTVTRILRRHGLPLLAHLDPLTGQVIRASKTTAVRYERARPGELVHVDVKKIGRIPDGGGWRAHGRQMGSTGAKKRARIGFDYVHSMVDDHSRVAYSEILPDEKGATCAGFLDRAARALAAMGIDRIERVMTDNHFSYRHSHDVARTLQTLGARHVFIRPHCPWQNGKVERFNRTLQTEWAYRQVFLTNQARADALAPWLDHYNTERHHSALGATPLSRLSPT